MKIRNPFTRERVSNGLKSLGKLRPKINHTSLITFSALTLILFIAFVIRLFPIRWEVQTGSMHLSEFDPYYQYSLTKRMVEHGLLSPYWPKPWVDNQRWYPYGLDMSLSYPAFPMTAAIFYQIVSALGINIDLMSFCAVFPAIMGTLACFIVYFLGKYIGGRSVGFFSALFLALSPSFIQRTSLGFFDTETTLFAFLLFAFLFLKAIEEERSVGSTIKYSIGAALALAYFVSGWGAAFYSIGLTTLFVLALILLKRYTQRILLSYSVIFGLGLFIAINVPNVSTEYLITSPVIPVAGVFILLCLSEILRSQISMKSKAILATLFGAALIGGFLVLWQLGYMQTIAGKFISVINPFAREASPLIESVAEHRITAWGSIYYEFGVGIIFFMAGLYFVVRNLDNKNLFLLIFGLTSLYFACSMVRLLVLMAPAYGLLASVGVIGVLKPFNTLLREPQKIVTKAKYGLEHVGKEFSGTAVFLIFLILMTNFAFSPQTGGIPKVYSQAYAPVTITAGSLPITPAEPVHEWLNLLDWTKSNLDATTVVCSWWDYGYWLTTLGNVTTLADNATINFTQIENIGFIFMANETQALKMLKLYNVKYILVFTTFDMNGNWIGWGDEGKWMWMARISGKAHDRFVNALFIDEQIAWTDESAFGSYNATLNKWEWNERGMASTIYKLMSYGKHQWLEKWRGGQDPDVYVKPEYFKEAYFAGLDLDPNSERARNYGNIVPLVSLYEIDWQK